MLGITEDDAHDAFLLEPSGKLTRDDFAALTERFDARIAAGGRAPNLVIHARDFPGWADFGALVKHLEFVRDHHRLVAKVALVSDSRILDLAPRLASHFVAAEIRHFPADEFAAALDWVGRTEAPRGKVTVMTDLPPGAVGISVEGVITARDYAEIIAPLIERALKDHAKIQFLYRIGPGFEGFTAGAAWSDARIGLMHLTSFAKVAVVSDLGWIRSATRAFAPLIPAEVQVFPDKDLAQAKAWIAG